MPERLSAKDHFSIISCSAKEADYWGVAASFWTKQELESVCAEKHKTAGNSKPDPFQWEYIGSNSESCLGPILSPASTKLTHE
jgi:hypothetical protein